MANMLHPDKRKVTYAEWKDVLAVIEEIASATGRTPTEIIRETVLNRANKELKSLGMPPLDPEGDRR